MKRSSQITKISQQDGQENESVSSSDQHHTHVHTEIVDAEDLRMTEGQYSNPAEFGQGDAAKYL